MKTKICYAKSERMKKLDAPRDFMTVRQGVEACRKIVGWQADPEWICPYFHNTALFKHDFPEFDDPPTGTWERSVNSALLFNGCVCCHGLSAIEQFGEDIVIADPCTQVHCLYYGKCAAS